MYQNFFTAKHLMVDLETTGLDHNADSIVEIGARKFDPFMPHVNEISFETTIMVATGRKHLNQGYWTETEERRTRLADFMAADTTAFAAFANFNQWIHDMLMDTSDTQIYLWAKPGHFEYGFLSSYYSELGLTNPFKYNRVVDLRSYIYGLFGPLGLGGFPEVAKMLDDILDSRSFKHRGLADVDSQIEMLAKSASLAGQFFDGCLYV